MAKEKKRKRPEQEEDTKPTEKTIDPYTGEIKPVPEDADDFIEVMPEETKDHSGSNYLLNEETGMDSYTLDANADAIAEEEAHYTEDEDIEEDFEERQNLAVGGRKELEEDLEEHHSLSPDISGGDIDAAWEMANSGGEETVGGSVVTPDQDQVDELGKAAGLNYEDDEPLDSDAKILARDRHRWELNPASSRYENKDYVHLDQDELDEEGLEELEEMESLEELEEEESEEDEAEEEEEDFEEEDLEDEDEEEEDEDEEDRDDEDFEEEDLDEFIDAELEDEDEENY